MDWYYWVMLGLAVCALLIPFLIKTISKKHKQIQTVKGNKNTALQAGRDINIIQKENDG